MSVTIKGMDKPKGCSCCPLRRKESEHSEAHILNWYEKCLGDGHCVKYRHETKADALKKLYANCPMVEEKEDGHTD